ncbi:MAG TPA: substrate-binding domain-containing protein [Bacillota bacterium]|nr:substrate-binding domain-containing protein [Bacillota bacterium]
MLCQKNSGKSGWLSRIMILFPVLIFLLFASFVTYSATKENTVLTLATTTSVDDSGLLKYLKPEFEKDTGLTLRILAQGTGQALKTGENGDADVMLVHSKKDEEDFVAKGFGLKRIELMYNYFVIVGPKNDPAGISGAKLDAVGAFKKIMETKSAFISRGDESGTHKKEKALWALLKVTPSGDWYVSAGKGMGAVLLMADEIQGYTLTDKATYLSLKEKIGLKIVVDAAPDLLNQYTLIAVNPALHEGINQKGAEKFIAWMTSPKALKMIGEYGKEQYGEGLFFVNYKG